MAIGSIEDFVKEFAGKDMGRDNYFGFDIWRGYHIHAKTFTVSGDGAFFTLNDVRGHIITKIMSLSIEQVTSCGADYWTTKGTLYLRGYK